MNIVEKQKQVHGNIFKPIADTEVLTPFGPVIAYKKLSDKFVKELNSHIDDDLPDHSDYLVGKVKQEKTKAIKREIIIFDSLCMMFGNKFTEENKSKDISWMYQKGDGNSDNISIFKYDIDWICERK